MFFNILLISLLIIIFFFISTDIKINAIVDKKNIKYLIVLLIIYFIYQNYNIIYLIILILIFIFFNTENNKYLDLISKYTKEKFENLNDTFDESNKSKKTIEPFKEEVIKLKDLYENIKMKINELK